MPKVTEKDVTRNKKYVPTNIQDETKVNYDWFDSSHSGILQKENCIIVENIKKGPKERFVRHQYKQFMSEEPFLPIMKTKLNLSNPVHEESILEKVIIPLLCGTHLISLRTLEWSVINYTKPKDITLEINSKNGTKTEAIVNIYTSYGIWLKRHGRTYFDPFKRKKRIFMMHNNKWYETTVGQLVFFYWAISKGVFTFVLSHIEDIKSSMQLCMSVNRTRRKIQKKQGKSKKRDKSLTNNMPPCMLHMLNMNIKLFA
jgi:hypothetical protein